MKRQYLTQHRLPDTPGVYIFRDYRRRPLYIGRATSLRDRVKSYFTNDLVKTRGVRLVDMVAKARSLTWQETDTVLEAVLLESVLIKRYQPFYNVDERDDRSSMYVVITNEPWPRVFLARARDFDHGLREKSLPYSVKKYFGPFPDVGLVKETLKILRRLFPFRDKKAHDLRHEAFYQAIGQSPLMTTDKALTAYLASIRYLMMFFNGQSGRVRTMIEKDMNRQARTLQFEDAARSRKLLHALTHINDISLIKRQKEDPIAAGVRFRIEAFDVAHLSGTDVVGSMVVIENGQARNSEYRRFKISREANNDLAGLIEILSRRLNHTEWTFPDLIVVDGNEIHYKAAESVLKARRMTIPVVAVTKNQKHQADRLIGASELINSHRADIIMANAEAHRFAIKYHRERRRQNSPNR